MTLNLKSDAGLNIFYDLVRCADVVYDNFRPEILQRLCIDYATLKSIKFRIISFLSPVTATLAPCNTAPLLIW